MILKLTFRATFSPFVLSVVTDRRSVTKSKDDQKAVSFDFGAAHLRSGRTAFKKPHFITAFSIAKHAIKESKS